MSFLDDLQMPDIAATPMEAPALPMDGMPMQPATPAQPPGGSGDGGGGGFKALMPLLPLLAAAGKGGGRMAIMGLLQGYQQAQARKQEQARLAAGDQRVAAQDARQGRLDQGNEDYRQQGLMLRAETQRQAQATRQQQVRQQFATALKDIDDPAAIPELARFFAADGSVPQADLERFAMTTLSPTKLQQRAAQKKIDKLRAEFSTKWMEEGAKFTHELPGWERVPFDELLRRAGMERDPNAPAQQAQSAILPDVPLDRQHATALVSGNTQLAGQIEEAMRRQGATRRDPPRPTTGSDPEIAELRKELLRLQVERAGEEKEPNQAQFTAATYAARMEQSEPTFGTVADTITQMSLPAFELQTNSWFARPTFQSKEVQSYMQAARNFINAVLRRESGAVISPSEFAEARQQYLPQPNDDPEALAQKSANRALVFDTMKRASGRAYQSPPAVVAPLTKDAKVGGVYMHNGKKVKVREKTRTGFLFDEVP